MYGFKSYISFPIILQTGEFFGTLCAIDPNPVDLENIQGYRPIYQLSPSCECYFELLPNESKLSVPTLLQLKCQPVRRLAFGIN